MLMFTLVKMEQPIKCYSLGAVQLVKRAKKVNVVALLRETFLFTNYPTTGLQQPLFRLVSR